MICPGCDRDNDPNRRYCGKCGHNFDPICRRCHFTNSGDDRFCGGCGALLIAKAGCHPRRGGTPPRMDDDAVTAIRPTAEGSAPVRAATTGARGPAVPAGALANELAGLFTPTTLPGKNGALPEAGIEQTDLDKLFGGTP